MQVLSSNTMAKRSFPVRQDLRHRIDDGKFSSVLCSLVSPAIRWVIATDRRSECGDLHRLIAYKVATTVIAFQENRRFLEDFWKLGELTGELRSIDSAWCSSVMAR